MAEETKTTSTRGRKPKAQVEDTNKDVVDLELESKDNNDMIKKLMAQMAELQKQVEDSKKEKSDLQDLVKVLKSSGTKSDSNLSGKKIKCVNLMHSIVNISTEPDGKGRMFTFNNYGDVLPIKFDFLVDIVSAYPYTMENGLIYICDKEAVEELGLKEEYTKVYDKEKMDKLIYLREETDLELFLGMEKNLQESTAIEIAKLLNANESMDYNYIKRIKEETDFDIEEIAKDLKENESRDKE